jgi:aldehyde:ferredoxin oxidoreductase
MANLGFEKKWYPKYLRATTGEKIPWDTLNAISERVFNLVRAFWVREYKGKWTSKMDAPPARWFTEPLNEGVFKGAKLDQAKYGSLLQMYYDKRGWSEDGIPRRLTLEKLGLSDVAEQLGKYVALSD